MNNPIPPNEKEQITASEDNYYTNIKSRFDKASVSAKYAQRKNVSTPRNRREIQCIEKALYGIPLGASVLDLPCGAGRLASVLEQKGFKVTEADNSQHMIDIAIKSYLEKKGVEELPDQVQFVQQDVMKTTFEDSEFDVVICNRLLHHFPTPALRRNALLELARISKGVVVISYFSNFAVSALMFHLKNKIKSRIPTDRIPIWFSVLEQDLEACGLKCAGTYPVRWGRSPQTYLRLEKIER